MSDRTVATASDRRQLLTLLAGLAVVVTLGALAVDGEPVAGEVGLFRWANDLPGVVGAPARVVMQAGTLGAGFALAIAAWFVTRRWRAGLAVAAGALAGWWFSQVAKDIVDRARPGELLTGVNVREHADGLGYPSGHAAMSAAVAAAITPQLPPRWRWVPWLVVAVVGLGRMYVGVHLPLDVVGGAALGLALGTAASIAVAARR